MKRGRLVVSSLGLALGLTAAAPGALAQPVPPLLLITSALPDPSSGTLVITGQNFGSSPFVTLDLVPLNIRSATDTRIVAVAPINMMPAGDYLLTVSRGPSAAEHASIEVTLGGGDPKGKTAPGGDKPQEPAAAASEFAASPDEPAAKVGDRVITLAEVDREWRRTDPASYVSLGRQLHEMRRQITDKLVADELLAREAASRGLTVEALLDEELPKRIVSMPDTAVVSLYEGLGDNARGATLEQMRPALRAWLERVTEPELARMNYLEELMKVSTRAELFLEPPRVSVQRSAQDAALGPDTAAVELVVFGDLQSPGYARFARAFGRVRETYGNRVRVVFKHFPAGGPGSVALAEAALCAKAQDRFWPFHDAVLAGTGAAVTGERLKQAAQTASLDVRRFAACFDGGEFRGVVQQALEEAGRYAIQASPSFLVNGRLTPDPPQFLPPGEFFTRVIEEELFRLARAARER
jgi:protein-disulfide isomerase